MRLTRWACLTLALFGATGSRALADPYAICVSDLPEAPKELVAKIKALQGSLVLKRQNARVAAFFKTAEANAKKLWTCSARTAETLRLCCHSIPVRLTVAGGRCLVGLPYGRLEIERRAMPVPRFLVWELQGPAVLGYSFGNRINGIELLPVSGASAPLANPHYHAGNKRRYAWENAGYQDDQAGHKPAVFPNGLVDSINDRCGDFDPLIINTD